MATSFSVSAKNNSPFGGTGLMTNISVKRGQTLMITADPADTWSGGTSVDVTSSANDAGNPPGKGRGPYAKGDFSFQGGSLLVSLDGGKTFFAIGTRATFPVLRAGTLSLYYWDNTSEDTSGDIKVDVTVGDTAALDKAPFNPIGTRWRVAEMSANGKPGAFRMLPWTFEPGAFALDEWFISVTPVTGNDRAFDCVFMANATGKTETRRMIFISDDRFIALLNGMIIRYGEKL